MPAAITIIRQTTSPQYEMPCDGSIDISARPRAASARPLATTRFVPTRSTIRALVGATMSITTAIGNSRTPACSGS